MGTVSSYLNFNSYPTKERNVRDDFILPARTGSPSKYPGFPDLALSTRFPFSWLRVFADAASNSSSNRNSTENRCDNAIEELAPPGPGGISVRITAAVTDVMLPSPSWNIYGAIPV